MVLSALYLLSMYRRVFFGSLHHKENRELTDLNKVEKLTLYPLVVLVFVLGLWPNLFLQHIHPTSEAILRQVKGEEERAAIAPKSSFKVAYQQKKAEKNK